MKERLIAHRGEPERRPENSLDGFRLALAAGAQYLETDVQLSADRVPVLSHDPSLLKMTGQDIEIMHTPFAQFSELPAGQPQEFGDRFNDYRIVRLAEFIDLLARWPAARAFVELKPDSLDAFGITVMVETVLDALAPVPGQCILISFDAAALQLARKQLPIGWVLRDWSVHSHELADRLAPDYLFVNRKRLPPSSEPLWEGPWKWVLYTVNVQAEIAPFLQRGIDMIETNAISRLLAESFGHGHG